MIKVAVCDDEKVICGKLLFIIRKYFRLIEREVLTEVYRSGDGLLESDIQFDIIFLDIEMPGLNGIETARKLRTWDIDSKIIYVTNYPSYRDSAYKVHAFDYVCKPIQESTVFEALGDAVHYWDAAAKKHKFAFKSEEGVIVLDLDEIYYFEYLSRKAVISSSRGRYRTYYSLGELYNKFKEYNFELSHKSYIVNMAYIKSIRGFDIILENSEKIPLAQKRTVEFKKRYNDFLQSTFDKV